MSTIGPGVMLVCITDQLERYGVRHQHVYECASVELTYYGACPGCGNDTEGLLLVGVQTPVSWLFGRMAFCPCAFVPAGRKGQFDTLLQAKDITADDRVDDEIWRRACEEAFPR